MRGIIAKIFDWIEHPSQSGGTPAQWVAGLVVILCISWLWSTVVRQID